MATSEICLDDSIRKDNMNKVANGETCHLLAVSVQVKETNYFLTPSPAHSNTQGRPTWVEEIFQNFQKLLLIDQKLSKFNEFSEKIADVIKKVDVVGRFRETKDNIWKYGLLYLSFKENNREGQRSD